MRIQSVQNALLEIAMSWGKGSEQRELVMLFQGTAALERLVESYPAISSPRELAYKIVTDLFSEPLDDLFDK